MKSLFERLLPMSAYQLDQNSERYNCVNSYIIPLLKSKKYYHDLTMHELQMIITFTDQNTYNWNRLDWLYGNKIFEELSVKEALRLVDESEEQE
jgi:hypothetical protein